eukprot:3716258-Amphidinium_carterae.1
MGVLRKGWQVSLKKLQWVNSYYGVGRSQSFSKSHVSAKFKPLADRGSQSFLTPPPSPPKKQNR